MAGSIAVREISRANSADVALQNEPFAVFGRLVPCYANRKWSYSTEIFPTVSEMTFPDELYDFARMAANTSFLGAYDGERCIGLAVVQEGFFRYRYLLDLKVNAAYRRRGVGAQLIGAACALAAQRGDIGLYTCAQDNNLAACRFYLKAGFEIGGFDSRAYDGTAQEGKSDIFFYKRIS